MDSHDQIRPRIWLMQSLLGKLPPPPPPPPGTKRKKSSGGKTIARKICLLGDPAVGKTSLIVKFVHDIFKADYLSTIGTKVTKKDIELMSQKTGKRYKITFNIWDVEGKETFSSVFASYYRGAKGALFVCDLTRRDTFENLPYWISKFKDTVGERPFIILTNKSDLKHKAQFKFEEVTKLAAEYNAKHYATSAKTGKNVQVTFNHLGLLVLKDWLKGQR